MGDGSDDPDQIEELFSLIERGVSVAVATRYSRIRLSVEIPH